MCGITGIFNTSGQAVSDAMAHIGPDGEGFYTDMWGLDTADWPLMTL
jgi:asparagine synthetase B (glutamine-hydrolysing)